MFEEYCMRDDVCGWAAVAHTLYRAELHTAFVASVMCAAVSVQILGARVFNAWPRLPGAWRIVVPGLVAYFAISFREPFDAAAGDSPIKSVFDIVIPMIVAAGFGWWLVWVAPFLMDIRTEMKERARNRKRRRERR